jgi:hypothetical protein
MAFGFRKGKIVQKEAMARRYAGTSQRAAGLKEIRNHCERAGIVVPVVLTFLLAG